MSSTTTEHSVGSLRNGQVPAMASFGGEARTPLPTRRRRPGLIALAVLLIVGCALASLLVVMSQSARVPVLVAKRPIAAGHVISADDIETAEISGSVRAVLSTQASLVVGQVAAVGLVSGQVLNKDMVAGAVPPAAGQSLVGLALKPGQMPVDGLGPGDRVQLFAAPAAGDDDVEKLLTEPLVIVNAATVFSIRQVESSADMLVTLQVPAADAARVGTYAAINRVGIVKVHR